MFLFFKQYVSNNSIATDMSIKITKDNYNTYKKVYEIIDCRLYRDFERALQSDTNPINVLNRWEAENQSIARRGLQAGLNDLLSSLNHCPKEIITDINAELERNLLPNLVTLSGFIHKTLKQVLIKGKIKTIDQYYIVKEVLDDTTYVLSDKDRRSLFNYLGNYESNMRT